MKKLLTITTITAIMALVGAGHAQQQTVPLMLNGVQCVALDRYPVTTNPLVLPLINNTAQTYDTTNLLWYVDKLPNTQLRYDFDGVDAYFGGVADIRSAWLNRVLALGPLAPGQRTKLTVTVVSNEAQAGTYSIYASDQRNCGAVVWNAWATTMRRLDVLKTQAVCKVSPAGALNCGADTTNTVQVDQCDVLRYTLTVANNGNVTAHQVVIRDPLPANSRLFAASGTGTGNAAQYGVMLRGNPADQWRQVRRDAVVPLTGQQVQVQAMLDTDLYPGDSLSTTIYTQVDGNNCPVPRVP